jgi:hypothetical protein
VYDEKAAADKQRYADESGTAVPSKAKSKGKVNNYHLFALT